MFYAYKVLHSKGLTQEASQDVQAPWKGPGADLNKLTRAVNG